MTASLLKADTLKKQGGETAALIAPPLPRPQVRVKSAMVNRSVTIRAHLLLEDIEEWGRCGPTMTG